MTLMNQKRIERTLKRMGIQIVEKARGASIYLIGLNERGYSIAKQMKPAIENFSSGKTPLHQLHTDDESTFQINDKIEKKNILVIVDDVIFGGGTMQRAINKIPELSQFEKIYTAVLIDRGHRKYPIHAEIVGVHVPTKLNEEVEVTLNQGIPENVLLNTK